MSTRISKVAAAYCNFLNSIDWKDDLLTAGLREGLNKFLSNAFIHLIKSETGKSKYEQADYISHEAKARLAQGLKTDLIYEHMVPKRKYIQKPCEYAARNATLSIEFVEDLLNRYWKIAVITKDEDKQLSRTSMPDDWDEVDVLRRYSEAQIAMIKCD